MAERVSIETGNDVDMAWGAGFDCAKGGGGVEECPYDPAEHPQEYAEWLIGWEDGNR